MQPYQARNVHHVLDPSIMLRSLILSSLLIPAVMTNAQINGYAQVLSITDETCTIGTANETAAAFVVGKHVVIMQMQDDVIGENVFNNASFGDLGNIASAGKYEIRKITAVGRSGATLTSVTLDAAPGSTFGPGANSTVQLITYELLGGGDDFTTTSNIGGLSWNGTIGGVIAFYVEGTLTLEHNITADMIGFRGGARTTTGEGSCNGSEYIYDSTGPGTALYAAKGEGIYKLNGTAWVKGRGHLLNGGGGGNSNNGGGGGGSNFTAGGTGGAGYTCSANASGGTGGVSLGTYASGQRVFMGGGGGGGEGDGNSSSVGMRGGGIILMKAEMLRTGTSCGGRTISANGGNANASGTDGAGGGGAGGSIVMEILTYDVTSGCPLTVRANGGNGGSVNNPTDHGAGGGGGQGALFFQGMVPIINVTTQTNNGAGGCNNNIVPCNSSAGSGAGINGAGINYYDASPLPVQLISFEANTRRDVVDLLWTTASTQENDLFVIERSADGNTWERILTKPVSAQSSTRQDHAITDERPLPGESYYRLIQEATYGEPLYSHVVSVVRDHDADGIILFPNPARDHISIHLNDAVAMAEIRIYNEMGQLVLSPIMSGGSFGPIDISELEHGLYLLMFTRNGDHHTARFVVSR